MLDAAAVCAAFLEGDRTVTRSICASTGFAETVVRKTLPFLVALHDLGKFAESFQDLRSDIVASSLGPRQARAYSVRHDRMGYMFWSDILSHETWSGGWPLSIVDENEGWDLHAYRDAMDPWLRAVTGHHGEPPTLDAYRPASEFFSPRASADAIHFVRDVVALLQPETLRLRDSESSEEALTTSAWSVAGLTVLCDWLGSNQSFFPFRTSIIPIDAYWASALEQARTAVARSGVLPASASTCRGMAGLFPGIAEPSPLQKIAETIQYSDGPQLVIAEEITGSGKTEAAIVLAQKLLHEGKADGVYIALPTMATANAMFARMRKVYERLFDDGHPASLVLTHSARHLDDDASELSTAWLSDHRKKALLSQVGVGTIDQALLAVLPAKHNVLRLLGLQRNVLIVDEIHAYDAYVSRILERLLEFHAALGGSAILLSATLPRDSRQKYLSAFAKGLGSGSPNTDSDAYPLLTHSGRTSFFETPLPTRTGSQRTVKIEFVHAASDVLALLAAAANDGRSACWIRNSVNDAIEAFDAMRQRIGEDAVTLFHARFTMGDRLRIERDVVRRFGPQSGSSDRSGRVVIATQVVEQSLDLDFDVMVSDLAPIDLLIQRAGRLHRHARTAQGDRTSASEDRPAPVMQILAPAWSDDPGARWLSSFLPRAARVYGHTGQLWLSMRCLREKGCIKVPDDARHLIESVYGSEAQGRIPAGLQKASDDFEAEQRANASLAGFNALNLSDGYKSTPAHWIEDTVTPTRLGEATTTIRLATRRNGEVVPLSDSEKHPWDLSQVSVRRTLVAGRALAPAKDEEWIKAAEDLMPDKGKWSLTLLVEPTGMSWTGRAADAKGNAVKIRYDGRYGLRVEKE
jgi:CRISPR-associated helicase Cas3/CRISPR-associated endonuclease Cas3-HD